jgi:protoporphyrinogen oxidase
VKNITYLILGAGPSGLTYAHTLLDAGVPREEILVLEAEAEPGGLCRSADVDGSPLDIGGGHFLDLRLKEVVDFLFRFLPAEEWNTHHRVAKIALHGREIDHPFEANLWQLDKATQVDYLESIAQAGCVRGEEMPTSFIQWVQWKFGARIADDYMLPYNRKIWSMPLDQLGTYWLYKLPNVSFRDTLRSCLENSAHGSLPAHGTFLYPKKYGYGEVWLRMGAALGDRLLTSCPFEKIDLANKIVNDRWQAKTIINTIPWQHWLRATDAVPAEVRNAVEGLRHVPIDVDYMPETLPTPAHWLYEPDEAIMHHRKLLRANFCPGSRGYWTETNAQRSPESKNFRHHNPYAYPVNTIDKPEAVKRILAWASSLGIIGLGRWGTWEHMNSDVTVQQALHAGRQTASQR